MKKVMIMLIRTIIVIICIPLLLALIFFGLIMIGYYTQNVDPFLRKTAGEIREELLLLTPVGSGMEGVIQLIDSNESWSWHNRYIAPVGAPTDLAGRGRVGVHSIRVNLGQYSGNPIRRGSLLAIHVTAIWGFDEDSNVVDIQVRKS